MSKAASLQDWNSAESPEAAVRALRAPLRRLLEAVSPASLKTYDVIYEGAAIDIISDIRTERGQALQYGGVQSAGFREHAAVTLLSFVINIAASLCVERFHADCPQAWHWLIGDQAPIVEASGARLDDILRRSGLSASDQTLVRAALSEHPDVLSKLLTVSVEQRPK